jgi:hypothetical protein
MTTATTKPEKAAPLQRVVVGIDGSQASDRALSSGPRRKRRGQAQYWRVMPAAGRVISTFPVKRPGLP